MHIDITVKLKWWWLKHHTQNKGAMISVSNKTKAIMKKSCLYNLPCHQTVSICLCLWGTSLLEECVFEPPLLLVSLALYVWLLLSSSVSLQLAANNQNHFNVLKWVNVNLFPKTFRKAKIAQINDSFGLYSCHSGGNLTIHIQWPRPLFWVHNLICFIPNLIFSMLYSILPIYKCKYDRQCCCCWFFFFGIYLEVLV